MMKIWLLFTILLGMLLFGLSIPGLAATQFFNLPPLQKPSEYGNILIDRQSTRQGQAPVGFSHWSHRLEYTCRVCHFELGFIMEVNATGITERGNRQGEFCGACHNDVIAFGHTEQNCKKCHNGGMDETREQRFQKLRFLPQAPFGNGVDWNQAVTLGWIWPRQSLYDEEFKPVPFKKLLRLQADLKGIPAAYFPHDKHQQWNDCADCHPDIFNVKKKTTEHFEMNYILDGKFCGTCHLQVAFPLDDCKRCHWGMKD